LPKGGRKEVVLPSAVYRDLLELKPTLEVYERSEVQQSLKRGRKDVAESRAKSFRKASEPIRWLKR